MPRSYSYAVFRDGLCSIPDYEQKREAEERAFKQWAEPGDVHHRINYKNTDNGLLIEEG